MASGGEEGGDSIDSDRFGRMLELTHRGREALALGHAKQALKLLTEKHALVIAHWGESAVFSATSAVDLADASLACGQFAEADKLLEWALDRYKALKIDDERALRALKNRAMSAYQAANYDLSEQRFIDLIDRYKTMGAKYDLDRAMTMDMLAQSYLRQSRHAAAEPLLLDALRIFERDGSDPVATAVCRSLLARMRFTSGRFREAEPLQRSAIASHEAAGDEMGLAKELDHLAITLAMRAQSEERADLAAEAVTLGERAVGIFERFLPKDHMSLKGSKQNLAKFKSLSASIGKMFAGGRDDADDPISVPQGHPLFIVQLLKQAESLSGTHDYMGALKLAREAHDRTIRGFGEENPLVGQAIGLTVGLLRRHVSYLLGEPTGVLSPHESMMMQLRAHSRRGMVEDESTPRPDIEAQDLATIQSQLREAIAIITQVTSYESSEVDQTRLKHVTNSEGFGSNTLEILHFARWLGVLDNSGAIGLAFEIMQLEEDSGAARGLAISVSQAGEGAARRALREEVRITSLERDTLIRSLTEANDPAGGKSAAEEAAVLPALEQKLSSLRRQLNSDDTLGIPASAKRIAIDQAQLALRPNEAIVAVNVGSRAVFVLAARPDSAVFKRIEMEGALVRVMCEAVVESATFNESQEIPDFDLVNALQLYDLMFRPLENFLQPGNHLLFLADGPLWSLPLGCLVVEPMRNPGSSDEAEVEENEAGESGFLARSRRLMSMREWRETQTACDAMRVVSERAAWFADRYRISLLPSFAPLRIRGRSADLRDQRRAFFGIGDPVAGSMPHDGLVAVPETRRMLAGLAAALGGDPETDVLVGSAATIDRLVDLSESGQLASRRVLCFATHAIYPRGDGDLLTDAGLLLSNGEVLTAFDIAALRLDAEFVFLTACFTGSPSGRSITVPLSGLAQAFLMAGARSLLVSHWPVEIAATELFVQGLSEAISTNENFADAVATAGRKVRAFSQEYAHPAFWAGFSIIGDGATNLSPGCSTHLLAGA